MMVLIPPQQQPTYERSSFYKLLRTGKQVKRGGPVCTRVVTKIVR